MTDPILTTAAALQPDRPPCTELGRQVIPIAYRLEPPERFQIGSDWSNRMNVVDPTQAFSSPLAAAEVAGRKRGSVALGIMEGFYHWLQVGNGLDDGEFNPGDNGHTFFWYAVDMLVGFKLDSQESTGILFHSAQGATSTIPSRLNPDLKPMRLSDAMRPYAQVMAAPLRRLHAPYQLSGHRGPV